jgi:electron transfer flavoprotein alpha subunit
MSPPTGRSTRRCRNRVDVIEQVVLRARLRHRFVRESVLGADVAAGVAARLEAGLNWDLVDLVAQGGELVGKRLALADSVLVDVGWRSPVRLALFRTGSVDAVATGGDARIETLSFELQDHSRRATIVSQQVAESEGPSIEDADVIVAGGIGLGAAENFALAETLAEILGGAVGATRAVVYKGWYPHSAQVGQTGKTVTPKLYIALGISGAVQHKVGM